jgi:hypothetical protein
MKMLRVDLVVSNFLEAPNGGGAGGNQPPAGAFSLRERCGGRGNNPHAATKDLRAVALQTREFLAELIVLAPACNIALRSQAYRITCYTKLLQTGAHLPDRPLAAATTAPLQGYSDSRIPQKRTRHLRRVQV